MLLNEISARDAISQEVVQAMIDRATVLEFAEFYSITGNADYTRKASTAAGGQFRALNSDYPNNQVNPAYANPTLKILGDKVQVDRAHERRGNDLASVRARDLLAFANTLGEQFQNYFFNGDTGTSADQFDGLKVQMPAGQLLTAATNGLAVTLGNDNTAKTAQQQAIELLDELIDSVKGGAQVLFMDGKTLSRYTTIARDFITYAEANFGRKIPFYNGIPIRPAGYDKDGNKIIPHTETVGTATDCTSVYAVRFGEGVDLSFATNIGVEVKDLGLVGVHYTHAVEIDADLALLNDKAVARLEGLRIV